MSFIYLASPYSSPDAAVVTARFLAVEHCLAALLRAGKVVYSPIVHNHEVATKYDLPKDFNFWQQHNFGILAKSSALWVLCLEGWQQSRGVQAEITFAKQAQIPVLFGEEFV